MKKAEEMTIEEIVRRYDLCWLNPDKIWARILPNEPAARAEIMANLRKRKPEILEYFAERDAAKKRDAREYQEKIDAISGLKEIRAALADLEAWDEEFNANMERGDSGVGLRPRPQYDMDAMRAKYPRAAAFLEAEKMSHSPHYVKSAAGRKALESIINGGDYAQALKAANAEWDAYLQEHVWD